MKTFRTGLLGLLILSAVGAFSSCATTDRDAATNRPALTADGRIEKTPVSPTADMNWVELTGYYLGWWSLESLYIFAGSNPSYSP